MKNFVFLAFAGSIQANKIAKMISVGIWEGSDEEGMLSLLSMFKWDGATKGCRDGSSTTCPPKDDGQARVCATS
jgi:hypothetical protein